MDKAFVIYHYPHACEYTVMCQNNGKPETLNSYNELENKSGFVFAPFKVTSGSPIMLLKPDSIKHHTVNTEVDFTENSFEERDLDRERQKYRHIFRQFHNRIINGQFKKIVLSRISIEQSVSEIDPIKLFHRACILYPRMFTALVSMPQCGTWLMATPEILVESIEDRWHTMSVAGTIHIDEKDTDENLALRKQTGDINEWNSKNIQEQAYVSQYISNCLQQHNGINIEKNGPYTLRAGMIKHLATDFTFNIADNCTIGQIINELHPTPAVCGIPKAEAYKYILENEGYERKYYSGFSGVINCDEGTHLYVTLRCMQIEKQKCTLYSGGGLLADSEENNEWQETEIKMETMRRCLVIKRM